MSIDAAFTVALALAVGVFCQALARHLRLPGIVLLLGAGVLCGPDGLGWIQPQQLGEGLGILVGFAVAVILFDGGMNLRFEQLRHAAAPLRNLVTWGALASGVGAFLAAFLVAGWDWRLALPFGALMTVTGPTVVQPLLRRIRVQPRLAAVLEGEAVFIDPLGAILAVVTLELVLHPDALRVGGGFVEFLLRLGAGAVVGLVGGMVIAGTLRLRWLVPEGLQNVLTLALVTLLYQFADSWRAESGIMAVSVAGLVVGNVHSHALEELRDFKEQLTQLMIGLLFVLLAAGVRLADVQALGWRGAATVAVLILVVRPLQAWWCTAGTGLTRPERVFIGFLAPRGIVAASVATLFATYFEQAGIAGGRNFQAMVFLVIAVTVLAQGLLGGWVAAWLQVLRPRDRGYVLLGGNALARLLGRELAADGQEVVIVDTNPDRCAAARREGLQAIDGSGTAEETLEAADVASRAGVVGLTSNEEANFLFASHARRRHRVREAWVALVHERIRPDQVDAQGGRVLFGRAVPVDTWVQDLLQGRARLAWWEGDPAATPPTGESERRAWPDGALPLVFQRNGGPLRIADPAVPPRREGDRLGVLVLAGDAADVEASLRRLGWRPAAVLPPAPPGSSSPAR